MTGIELIAKEREEQLVKHGRTVDLDVEYNKADQLIDGAIRLLLIGNVDALEVARQNPPRGWQRHIWIRMCDKPLIHRLTIAGALLAAEIDRLKKQFEIYEREIKALPG